MTPAEQEFITLWNQGLTCPAIAQRLGIPPGTARSRAYTLQQQGKIAARPRGGRRTPARASADGADGAPAQAPAITFLAVPEVRELIQTVKDLVARVAALEDGTREPTRGHPHPWHHQAMDGPAVATADRGSEGPGRRRGQGAESSGGGAVIDRADRSSLSDVVTEPYRRRP